ncbi:MAG: hypothetical protein R3B65_03445 [Candidatus Paceibacterota bacterium]
MKDIDAKKAKVECQEDDIKFAKAEVKRIVDESNKDLGRNI